MKRIHRATDPNAGKPLPHNSALAKGANAVCGTGNRSTMVRHSYGPYTATPGNEELINCKRCRSSP